MALTRRVVLFSYNENWIINYLMKSTKKKKNVDFGKQTKKKHYQHYAERLMVRSKK